MTRSRFVSGSVIVALCVALDQLSKFLVEQYLPFQEMVPVVPFGALFRTWNEGVAFSFLTGFGSWGLVLLALLVVGLVLWLWAATPADRPWLNIGYAMIIGGALGNLLDRAIFGHVVDFVLLHYGSWSFAIFNIADSFISVGVALIILDELRSAVRKNADQ